MFSLYANMIVSILNWKREQGGNVVDVSTLGFSFRLRCRCN